MKNPVDLLHQAIEDERYVLRGYEKPSEALTYRNTPKTKTAPR